MRINYLLPLIIFASLLEGCSTSQIYSVHASGHKAYSKILIYADYSNLIQKVQYEDAIADELESKNIKVWLSVDLFPPLRDYDSAYYAATQQSQGYEAIMYLIPDGVSTSTHSTAYRNWFGGISSNSHDEVDNIYSTVVLIDAETNKRVYYASFTSGIILRNMAMDLVKDFKKFDYLKSSKN